jgi:polyisoprenyl-phosphate glycosyltransferase
VISVVVPVFNEESCLPELRRRLAAVLDGAGLPWEIVFVNDGSRDGSAGILDDFHKADARIKCLHLSRNFGHQIAVTAGIDHAAGDAVVTIDADLQDPPELIAEMIRLWKEDFQVVYARRTRREKGYGAAKNAVAKLFYRTLALIAEVKIPIDTGDFRLMDRRVADAVRAARERNRFVRGLSVWAGFRQTEVVYDRAVRAGGESHYSLRKLALLGLDGIFSFSIAPLRIATFLGLATSAAAFLLILWGVWIRFYSYYPPEAIGWASLITVVLFMGGIQLVMLGILGEYIGRIYEEAKRRPMYLIARASGIEPREVEGSLHPAP